MAKEANLWNRLKTNMKGLWDAPERHEDLVKEGVADVSFAIGGRHGWMELKCLDDWPKRPTTVVRIEHYTEEQRRWLRTKGEAAGNVWLLLQVDKELILFYWPAAVHHVGLATRQELYDLATWRCTGRAEYQQLARALGNYQ